MIFGWSGPAHFASYLPLRIRHLGTDGPITQPGVKLGCSERGVSIPIGWMLGIRFVHGNCNLMDRFDCYRMVAVLSLVALTTGSRAILLRQYPSWLRLLNMKLAVEYPEFLIQLTLMPFIPIPKTSSKPNDALCTASTPTPCVSEECSLPSSPNPLSFMPFSILSISISEDDDEVEIQFSDQRFHFLTSWLYSSRKSEGLPSPDGCKNPSKIRITCVNVTGVGIRATVDVTWNTGTTSPFPALLLRVFGPTKALEQERCEEQLPEPGGRNPLSGVGRLTLDEKRVADRYRAMLMETMKEYVDVDWISETPTSLLREMVRYVEVEMQSERETIRASAAELAQNDATADSSGDDSLIDEEVIK